MTSTPGQNTAVLHSPVAASGALFSIKSVLVVAILSLGCITPAIWNGYPLVFSDTNAYIGSGFAGAGLAPYYNIPVYLTSRPFSLWFTAWVQAVVAASIVWIFLGTVGGSRNVVAALAVSFAILVASQLPWVASYIMPDVFAGLGAACLLTLFLVPRQIHPIAAAFLFCTAVFSALVSTANILIFLALCVFCAGLQFTPLGLRSRRRSAAILAIGYIILVVALGALPNILRYGQWTINAGSGALTFSSLVDQGLAQRFLQSHCPSVSPMVCKELPALMEIKDDQGFLWNGLADKTGAWVDKTGEFKRLNLQIMASYPRDVATFMVRQTISLLSRVSLAEEATRELSSYGINSIVHRRLITFLPAEEGRYLNALQQKGTIREYYPAQFYTFTNYLGYVLLVGLLLRSICSADRVSASLILATLCFITMGLAIQGGLVGPYPRYHAKVSWVAWLIAGAVVLRLQSEDAAHRNALPSRADKLQDAVGPS